MNFWLFAALIVDVIALLGIMAFVGAANLAWFTISFLVGILLWPLMIGRFWPRDHPYAGPRVFGEGLGLFFVTMTFMLLARWWPLVAGASGALTLQLLLWFRSPAVMGNLTVMADSAQRMTAKRLKRWLK